MNSSLVQLLGTSIPPRLDKTHAFANSFTVSHNGDIALLSEGGCIHFSTLRLTSQTSELIELTVRNIRTEDLLSMSTMEFDAEGKTLLLWSERKVGIVELPTSLFNGLNNDEIDTECLYTSLWDANDEGVPNLVAKASFHNICSHCVVILMRKDIVRLVDLRSLESEIIPLSSNKRFVSFTFGPAIEWMQFTLVLLSGGGDVYYLCPIIPRGTVLSVAAVSELWTWAELMLPESREFDAYSGTASSYLFSLFGPRPVFADELVARNTFLRAGEASTFNSEEDSAVVDKHSAFFNYIPALRGPVSMRRDAAAGELREVAAEPTIGRRIFVEEKPFSEEAETATRRIACDISTLGSTSGPAFDRAPAAPVMAIAYSSGEVDILLLDFLQTHPPGASVHSSSSFVGPSWRSLDLSRPGMSCSAGGLLLAEVVSIRAEDDTQTRCAPSEQWRLTADPVLSHVLHVTCARLCEAYLLSVVWLEKVIESQLESGWDDAASEVSSPVGDATSFSSPLTHPSRVLPLFFLPPQSEDSAGGSSSNSSNSGRGGHQESKASERGGPGAASAGAMSGLGVVHDAMLGHVALFRTSSGMTSAVNLTLHVKLCELQDSLQGHIGDATLLPLKEELGRATNSEQIRRKRSEQCIKNVAEGLRDMPQLDAATASALTSQSSSQNKKVLLETAQKLERNVLVPLNELAQTTLFSYEMLQETYRSQVQVLEGSEEEGSDGSLSQGLKKLIVNLNSDHEAMEERVRKIQDKFAEQREKAERFLAFAVTKREKLTKAEGLYKKQLETWSHVVSQMNEQVANLRVLSGSFPVDSTAGGTGHSSPRAPPLFSTTNAQSGAPGSAFKGSPSSSRFFRSPGPAPAGGSPRAGSTSAQSPSANRYNNASDSQSFGTPIAPGKVGGGGPGLRPYSTPASTPTPTPSTPGGGPTGTGTGTPASAMFNRQYHTRHPPQVSPSPNFYSQYKSRTGGAEATPSTAGATAGGASTARTVRTASHFGSPNLRSPQAVGRDARGAPEPEVVLSQQDQDACTELLVSQTELLEKAQLDLAELETKLKSLQRENST